MSAALRRYAEQRSHKEDVERYSNLAKTVSLCRSLEEAHSRATLGRGGAPPLSRSNYSKKLREAIIFTSCGSYEADRVPVPVSLEGEFYDMQKRRTQTTAYVDKFVDGWTIDGVPEFWYSRLWAKHKRSKSSLSSCAMAPSSPQRNPRKMPPTAHGSASPSLSRISRVSIASPSRRGQRSPSSRPASRSAMSPASRPASRGR